MPLRIRRGRRTDFEALSRLAGWPKVDGSERRSVRLFRRVVADLGADLYVAEEAGEAVGLVAVNYVRVLRLGGQRAMVEELVVRADRRGAGIGRSLLEFALRRALRRGVRAICAVPSSEEGERILGKAGFRPAGSWWEWTAGGVQEARG
jgi:GNAT superfamily N-acetyltransferase